MSGPTVEKEVTAVTILVTKQDEKNLNCSLKFFLEKHEQNADMYVKVGMLKTLITAHVMYNNMKHTHQISLTA